MAPPSTLSLKESVTVALGHSNGTWLGTDGITSTAAALMPLTRGIAVSEATDMFSTFPATYRGLTGIDNTTVLIGYSLLASDANQDGNVGFPDLVVLAQNYNGTGKRFSQGDFDYDGVVDFDDLIKLAQQYGQTALVGESNAAKTPQVASRRPDRGLRGLPELA